MHVLMDLVQGELCKTTIRTSICNKSIDGKNKLRKFDTAVFIAFGARKTTLHTALTNNGFTAAINKRLKGYFLAV